MTAWTRVAVGLFTLAATGAVAAPASSPAPHLQPPTSRILLTASKPRVLPFTSNLVTGPFRGTQHCYICDLGDEPAVLVFARGMDAPTAALLRGVRDAVRAHADRRLFGWFVFLGDAGPAAESRLEEDAFAFARSNHSASVPISVLGEPDGPPGYLIPPSARVTVLVFRQRKVLARRSYTAGQWTLSASRAALAELPRLIAAVPRVRPGASGVSAPGPAIGPVDVR